MDEKLLSKTFLLKILHQKHHNRNALPNEHVIPTPAQTAMKNKINVLRQEILAYDTRNRVSLLSTEEFAIWKKKKVELEEAEKKLNTTEKSAQRSAKYRENRKRERTETCSKNPEFKKKKKKYVRDQGVPA